MCSEMRKNYHGFVVFFSGICNALTIITFANGWLVPICDIEPALFQGYIRGCRNRPKMKTSNRRESPRIDIRLRCHVTSPALWARSTIYTENISRSGVLIAWESDVQPGPPAMGQIVTIEIELPANHGFGQKCIHCQGTVTRVGHPDQEGYHVALRVNYMDFRSFHDRLRSLESMQPVASSWTA